MVRPAKMVARGGNKLAEKTKQTQIKKRKLVQYPRQYPALLAQHWLTCQGGLDKGTKQKNNKPNKLLTGKKIAWTPDALKGHKHS